MKFNTKPLLHRTAALTLFLTAIGGGQVHAQDDTVIYGSVVSSMNWGEGGGPGI